MENIMFVFDGKTHLDYLDQKSLRYEHHRENDLTSLYGGLIPSGLKFNKCTAFKSVTNEFEGQWNSILYNAEKRLVKLSLKDSKNAFANVQIEIELEILDSEKTYDVTLELLKQKHAKFRQNLE